MLLNLFIAIEVSQNIFPLSLSAFTLIAHFML